MDSLFLSLLNMSFMATMVIIIIIIIRLLLKKAPKVFAYALWAVVLFKLLCPFSWESAIGLLPTAEPIPQNIVYQAQPQINSGLAIVDSSLNEVLPAATPTASVNPIQIWIFIGRIIWSGGILVMLIYSIIQYALLKRRLIGAKPFRANIYLADGINSPFVLGLIKPKIYLPSSLPLNEYDFIIAHENCHIKRLDHITRVLAFIALTLHWFNPLVWLAYILSAKDMEMSCDEAVMKDMGGDIRLAYSTSLLRLATGKKLIFTTPLAFGEGDTKGRIKNVLNYKRPVVWVSAICLVLVIVAAICLIPNSSDSEPTPDSLLARFEQIEIGTAREIIIEQFGEPHSYGNWGYDEIYLLENAQIAINYVSDSEGNFFVEDMQINTHARLSLNDLIMLAPKGEDLSWADFEDFPYVEAGSGLHIRVYGINDLFSFIIGGDINDPIPMYMTLYVQAGEDIGPGIDIRYESITDFISEYGMGTEADPPLDDLIVNSEALWQNRTEYIGDNAAVGNILSNLHLPQDVDYLNFSLATEEAPFGLTVNLSIIEDIANIAGGNLSGFLEQSSAIAFSLIGNVDNISFDFNDGYSVYGITFYRSDIEKIYGEDLFSKTATLEDFELLLNEIYYENNDAPLDDLIPMVMINNQIYIDTGKLAADIPFANPLSSSFDGLITSSVKANERPTKNNQSNFGTEFGYKIIDAENIAIYINENWYQYKLDDEY